MNAQNITVYIRGGGPIEYSANPDRHLRAIIGKHGELRIMQVQVLDDVNMETGQQEEKIKYLEIHHERFWVRYTSG